MRLLRRVQSTLYEHRFGLAALLIPLGVRAIPEIIVGPYPVGWDTIAFYVPVTLDWAAGKAGFLEMLGTAPLMYMISVPVYALTRVNPVWIFKVMGPVLYGGVIWALFRFLRLGFGWHGRRALGGALLTALYFVTLRIGWDMYRNMLGLTFILLSLPFLQEAGSRRSQALLSSLTLLAVAADQLTGVIMLFLITARGVARLYRGRRDEFLRLVRVSLPGLGLFLGTVYAGQLVSGIGLVHPQPPVPGVESVASSLGFLVYAYFPILPLAALGFGRVRWFDLRSWSIFGVVAAFTALLPYFGLIVVSYRWSLLLSIPLCVYAAAGLARLTHSVGPPVSLVGLLQRKAVPIISTVLVFSAALYVALPAQQAMMYYAAFPALLPTSMVQNTVPLSDMGSLREMLDWTAATMGPGTALITHQAIYGWARAYFPMPERIVNYEYSSPLVGVEKARLQGYSHVLMIWWTDGLGWHGQPSVPIVFSSVYRAGNLAVYTY